MLDIPINLSKLMEFVNILFLAWWEIRMLALASSPSKYCPNLSIKPTRICDRIDPCMEGSGLSQNEGPSSILAIESN